MNAATTCVDTAAVTSCRNPRSPEAAPAIAGSREIAPIVEDGAAIAFANPIAMPGMKSASGCQIPASANAAIARVPANAIIAPMRIIRCPPTRLVTRAAIRNPVNEASAGKNSNKPKRDGDTPRMSIATYGAPVTNV